MPERRSQAVSSGKPLTAASSARKQGLLDLLNELFAPKGIANDFVRLLTLEDRNLLILGAGLGLSGLAVEELDDAAFAAVGPESLDDVSDGFAFIGNRRVLYSALVGSFLVGKVIDDRGLARTATQLTQAVLLTDFVITPVKYGVSRLRPDATGRTSFPSGHTAGAFALATVINHNHGKKLGIPAYALATLMGISRIDERRHFLSDVIAGGAIGIVVANTVNERFDR